MDNTQNKLNEECGVFGIFSQQTEDVAHLVYYGLYALQHRGQQSCGICVNDDGLFNTYKDVGLVNEVFDAEKLEKLGQGTMAIGHVCYGAASGSARANSQPILVNHVKGRMSLANNGCLVNAFELRRELEMAGAIFHTHSDAELISHIIIRERITSPSIEEAVSCAMTKLKGAYSLVIMSPTKLIAARDPGGIKPLCYGTTKDGSYVFASESCALDAVGATLVRELKPGEVIIVDKNGIKSNMTHCGKCKQSLCVFEYVYFARPDSTMEGCSVHKARRRAGAFLAKEHPVDADIVIGVPDSGLDAAIGYSTQSGIPYGIGFLKNKYIGRTFIAPGQKAREDLVRIKLNPISDTVKGKRVVLIDDSIVRGTTCARIVRLLREAGATEVHMRISSPPFTNPCYYGTDIDSKDKLIACKHTIEEITEIIGADTLGYLSLENVVRLAGEDTEKYCTACFDGNYPTEIPTGNQENKYDKKLSERTDKKDGGNK